LELGRQGRKLVRSPPIGTLLKDGEFFKKENLRKFVYIQETLVE
jgi:hypothetical protein